MSTFTEKKCCDKFQHPFMIKTLNKLGRDRKEFPQPEKRSSVKILQLILQLLMNNRMLSPKIPALLFKVLLAKTIRQDKEIKRIQPRKKEVKFYLQMP